MQKKFDGAVKTIDLSQQGFKASAEGGERYVSGYFTTSDIDRIGDMTLPSAFDKTMKQFMKNPVVTWMHDWRKVLGKVVDYNIDDKGVWVKVQVAKGIDWIDEIWSLIKQDIVKAFSFGYKVNDSDDAEVDGRKVRRLKDIELFEVAVVTVPMNASALFTLGEDGGLKSIAIRRPVQKEEKPKQIVTQTIRINAFFNSQDIYKMAEEFKMKLVELWSEGDDHIAKLAEPVKLNPDDLPEGVTVEDEEKAVVPYGDLPLADRNAGWSFSAADGNALLGANGDDWAQYKKAHVWFDPNAADTRAGYKLPIAKLSGGTLTAYPRGVIAAAAVMQGARGGASIPSGDEAGVKAHLAKYYSKMDMQPPWEKAGFTAEDAEKMYEEATQQEEPSGDTKVGRTLSANSMKVLAGVATALEASAKSLRAMLGSDSEDTGKEKGVEVSLQVEGTDEEIVEGIKGLTESIGALVKAKGGSLK